MNGMCKAVLVQPAVPAVSVPKFGENEINDRSIYIHIENIELIMKLKKYSGYIEKLRSRNIVPMKSFCRRTKTSSQEESSAVL